MGTGRRRELDALLLAGLAALVGVAWLIGSAVDGCLELEETDRAVTLVRLPRHHGAAKYLLDVAFAGRDRLTLGSYDPSFASAWQQVGSELAGWRETSVLWDPAGDRRRVLVAAIAGLAEISISIFGPMNLPNPPWYRHWSVLLAGVIGLAVITAIVGWRGLSQAGSSETTVTTQTPVSTTVPTTTTTPPTSLRRNTTTRPPGLLWTETGSDQGRSPGFRAQGRWRIEWSFDCSNFRGLGGGNFKITGDGAFERVEIQRFAVEASGERELSSGGYGHLLITSVCKSWTVTARGD